LRFAVLSPVQSCLLKREKAFGAIFQRGGEIVAITHDHDARNISIVPWRVLKLFEKHKIDVDFDH